MKKTTSGKDKPSSKVKVDWKSAARAARGGRVDAVLETLEQAALDAKNGVHAQAALAEIYAYREDWERFLPHALAVMKKPSEVVGNTVEELPWLLVLAGQAIGRWDEMKPAVKACSYLRVSKYLSEQIAKKGKAKPRGRDEDDEDDDDERPAEMSLAERERRFAESVADDEKQAKKRRKPMGAAEKARGAFLSAEAFGLEALALENVEAALPALSWEEAMRAAKFLARRGRPDDAWRALKSRLEAWIAVSDEQVAPLELLCDETLRALMTTARREEVLCAARGGDE